MKFYTVVLLRLTVSVSSYISSPFNGIYLFSDMLWNLCLFVSFEIFFFGRIPCRAFFAALPISFPFCDIVLTF